MPDSQNLETLPDQTTDIVPVLKTLSNERRLQILYCLALHERSVGELAEALGSGQSATSQHLGRLRQRRLVKTRQTGTTVYYSLTEFARYLLRNLTSFSPGINRDTIQ